MSTSNQEYVDIAVAKPIKSNQAVGDIEPVLAGFNARFKWLGQCKQIAASV